MASTAKSIVAAALTGTAAFAAAAVGLSNTSTPTQFGLAVLSAVLSGGLAYWQTESKLVHSQWSGKNSANSATDEVEETRFPKTNLPAPFSSFVGRSTEISAATNLLKQGRLVTLTGPGGCGKSRLGLEVALQVASEYPAGVWLTDLAELSDGSLLVERVSAVLGVPHDPADPQITSLTNYLRPRRLLLVLDNCEHLLDSCASLASEILKASAQSGLLATSRQPLGVVGEKTLRVGPLPTPNPEDPSEVELAANYDAVRLFSDRTRDVVADFEVTVENARTVAFICHRLDGIPLAIELAAAKVEALGAEEVAQSLDDRFRLLRRDGFSLRRHQQTLQATVDWSYELLTPEEQALFNGLSVFSGGWTLKASQAVMCGRDLASADIRDLVARLVEKSLVIVNIDVISGQRYRLLETLREYGRVRLESDDEADSIRLKHAIYFSTMVQEAQSSWGTKDQTLWLRILEAENDNIRSALQWWIERSDTNNGLQLAIQLWPFWDRRSYFIEGRRWMEELLRLPGGSRPTTIRALALNNAGNLAYNQGDLLQAQVWYQESMSIRAELNDEQGVAGSLNNLGLIYRETGEYGRARSALGRARRMNRIARRPHWEAINLNNLGVAIYEQGHAARARGFHERSLAIFETLQDQWGIAMALCDLADVVLELEGADGASQLFELSLSISKAIGDRKGTANALHGLGLVAASQGDHGLAKRRHEEALRRRIEIGDRRGVVQSIEGLAELEYRQKRNSERTIALFASAAVMRKRMGASTARRLQTLRRDQLKELRAAVGDERFESAWTSGIKLSLDDAYEQAMTYSSDSGRELVGVVA